MWYCPGAEDTILTHSDAPPSPLESRSSGPLTGKVRVPGDKSISHRALILGALWRSAKPGFRACWRARTSSIPPNRCRRWAPGWSGPVRLPGRCAGVGVAGFAQPAAPLDFGNSGTGCRLVMGAVAGCPITAVFDGDASLRSRPMRRILDPLELMGAQNRREQGRRPPAADAARRPRSGADPVPDPGGLGADQVGGAAGGAGCPRRHHRDRAPRPAATIPN